jgi:hypothetical protein
MLLRKIYHLKLASQEPLRLLPGLRALNRTLYISLSQREHANCANPVATVTEKTHLIQLAVNPNGRNTSHI